MYFLCIFSYSCISVFPLSISFSQHHFWTAHITGRSLKGCASIGYSVIKNSVCLCVCVRVLQVTVFELGTYFFGHNSPSGTRKKLNFLFFEIYIFGPLRAPFRPFSSIFFFILCKSSVHATNHTDRLTNLKISFLPLLGILLFSRRALKAKHIIVGIGTSSRGMLVQCDIGM